jgi:uncharacterized protein YukE
LKTIKKERSETMGSSGQKINVNTNELRLKSTSIKQIMDNIDDLIDKVEDNIEQMKELWQDDMTVARDKYENKMDDVISQVRKYLSPGIQDLAENLDNTAIYIENYNSNI